MPRSLTASIDMRCNLQAKQQKQQNVEKAERAQTNYTCQSEVDGRRHEDRITERVALTESSHDHQLPKKTTNYLTYMYMSQAYNCTSLEPLFINHHYYILVLVSTQ